MKKITMNIDTMKDSFKSANFNSFMKAIELKFSEGHTIRVVQEAVNMEQIELFVLNDYEEFETWVNNGCPSQK